MILLSKRKTKTILFLAISSFLFLPLLASADSLGQKVNFYVEPIYDKSQRNTVEAVLIYIGDNLYFYLDNDWWNPLDYYQQQKVREYLSALDREFSTRIYPTLTSNFGFEARPGIDKDNKITIFIHPMDKGVGGYQRSQDGYSRFQVPGSNEREIIYLNSENLDKSIIRSFLAHEFVHLITFNQKDVLRQVSEETWLNEARADYAPTLLGYDQTFQGSNLEMRQKTFLSWPSDSITEWQGQQKDYGALNLFTQYLVDHYGLKILTDSLRFNKVGIPSINEALKSNGFSEDFSQIFRGWLLTVFLNDCGVSQKYCYKNQNLTDFFFIPSTNFLPLFGESTLILNQNTKDWAGNWFKFIGGNKDLKIEFSGNKNTSFVVPYVVEDFSGKRTVKFLYLDAEQKGSIFIEDFGNKNISLTILPFSQSKFSGFGAQEPVFDFSVKVSIVSQAETQNISVLLTEIARLQAEIKRVQSLLDALLGNNSTIVSCSRIENNLYYGMKNDQEVKCLQEFLKSQGMDIYPEGIVSGNFLALTRQATIRFQEKYKTEILIPLGLEGGTGFVGSLTRSKINQLLLKP